jgi:fucose permease
VGDGQQAALGKAIVSRPLPIVRQVWLAYFAFILIGANDGAVGVLLPGMRAHYGVDKGTIGLIFLAGSSGYLSAAFSSGLLLEKLGSYRRFLALGALVFMLGAVVLSLTPPFAIFLATFLAMGFGVAAIDAGLNAYIASLPDNTALLNYLHAFYGVGALLGPLLASALLAVSLPWNSVYVVWIVVSLGTVLGFLALFHGRDEALREHKAEHGGNVLVAALKLRVVQLGALFLLVYVGAEVTLGSWTYSFLTEERHEAALLSGWIISGYWLGLTLGRFSMGRVAQWLGNARLIQACLAGVVVGVLLVWLVPHAAAAAAGMWLTGFSLGPIFPTTIALMSGRVPARLLPSAIGFLASMGSMGVAFFPWIEGNLAERFGLWTLLPFVVALTALMLLIWLPLRSHHAALEAEAG